MAASPSEASPVSPTSRSQFKSLFTRSHFTGPLLSRSPMNARWTGEPKTSESLGAELPNGSIPLPRWYQLQF